MPEEVFEEICLTICIDKNGHIKSAKNADGTEIKYHPDQATKKQKLDGSQTRLLCPNICCWRNTPQGMKCSPAYC